MKKTLKRLAAVVLAAMIMLSVLSMSVFAAEDKTVYKDITSAVKAFRKMASDWPSEITIYVAKETIDDLCDVSGFDPWSEFRQQFVANMSFESDDMLWMYGVKSTPYKIVQFGDDKHYEFTYKCALTKDQIKETDEAAEDLVEELKLKNLTDFEKIKAVYDWFTKNVTYTEEGKDMLYPQTPYGSLVNHDAVCAGIGLGVEKVLDLVGVDCVYLSGYGYEGKSGLHGWNFVKLNGKYYGLDATWDNGAERYSYFLTGSDTFTNSGTTHIGFGIFGEDNFKKKYKLADKDFLKPGVAGFSYVDRDKKINSFSMEPLGDYNVVFKWSPVSGAKNYDIQYAAKGNDKWNTACSTQYIVALQISFSGFENKVFSWRIRSDTGAVSNTIELAIDKKSKEVSTISETTPLGPSIPYMTYCASKKAGAVSLRWTTTDDAEKYILYMSTDGKSYKKIYTTTGGSAQVSKLESGKTYYFALKAVGPDGTTTSLGDTYSKKITVK